MESGGHYRSELLGEEVTEKHKGTKKQQWRTKRQ